MRFKIHACTGRTLDEEKDKMGDFKIWECDSEKLNIWLIGKIMFFFLLFTTIRMKMTSLLWKIFILQEKSFIHIQQTIYHTQNELLLLGSSVRMTYRWIIFSLTNSRLPNLKGITMLNTACNICPLMLQDRPFVPFVVNTVKNHKKGSRIGCRLCRRWSSNQSGFQQVRKNDKDENNLQQIRIVGSVAEWRVLLCSLQLDAQGKHPRLGNEQFC